MRFSLSLLLAATALSPLPALISLPALAQQSEPLQVTITASASQRPVEVARAGTSVSVVLAEDMEKQGITTVADALRFVPGITLSTSGSKGSLTSLRIRGGESSHTLVIIDGVAMNNPDQGTFDFSQLPVSDIERIEVLRGPQSGIYGSNAHAGVVSIITKSGKGIKRAEATIFGEAGSMGTYTGGASYANAVGPAYGMVSVQGFATEGQNIARTGSEKDGSRSGTFSSRLGFDLNSRYNIESSFRYLRRDSFSDGEDWMSGQATDSPDKTRRDDVIGAVALTGHHFGGDLITKLYTNGYATQVNFESPFYNSQDHSSRAVFGGRGTYYLNAPALDARQSFTLFSEHVRENFDTANDYAPLPVRAGRASTGLGGEYRIDMKNGLSLSGAMRNDFNDIFMDALTWRGTAAYKINATDTLLHASLGKGVTNPTFYQQFGYTLTFTGNPNLKPESSLGWDAGITQGFLNGRLSVDLTYFSTDTTDAITGTGNTVTNLAGTTTRQGVETSATFAAFNWLDLKAGYTYTDGKQANGNPLVRRARNTGSVEATGYFLDRKLTAALGANFIGERSDYVYATGSFVPLSSYTLINARLAYKMTKETEIYLRGENLLNEKYEDVYSYRSTGAAVYAGFKTSLGQ